MEQIYLKTKNENFIGKKLVRIGKMRSKIFFESLSGKFQIFDDDMKDFMKVGYKYEVIDISDYWGWDPKDFVTEKEYRKLKLKRILK